LSRLVKTDGVGKQRDRLMKGITLSLRELAGKQKLDEDARDMVAFIALALHEVYETIDVTCLAWEKRDYWLKADQFRREWEWTRSAAEKLEKVVLQNEWQELPLLMASLSQHLSKVNLPKRNTLGEPWLGAYAALREKRGIEKAYAVK